MELNAIAQERLRNELQDFLLALYRVTDLLPQDEPLRALLREEGLRLTVATEQMLCGVSGAQNVVEGTARALSHYFVVAKEQGWVRKENYLLLAHYLKDWQATLFAVTSAAPPPPQTTPAEKATATQQKSQPKEPQRRPAQKPAKNTALRQTEASAPYYPGNLTPRQQKILTFLTESPAAQVSDLSRVFPALSKRTIRRDLDQLVRNELVKREGRTNGTLYTLIRT